MKRTMWIALGVVSLSAIVGLVAWRFPPKLGLKGRIYSFVASLSPEIAKEGYRQASEAWRAREPVQGYFDRHSVRPGETVNLMLSRTVKDRRLSGDIIVERVGGKSQGGRVLMRKLPGTQIPHQVTKLGAAAIGAGWRPTLSLEIGPDWPSGVYLASFVDPSSTKRSSGQYLALLVVTNPRRDGDLLVKLPTATYAAYNAWGGHSLYGSAVGAGAGHMVSFDRPEQGMFLQWDDHYLQWVQDWALANSLTVDFATNFDVHRDATLLEDYPLAVLIGHDEYWSKEEFDHTYRRIFELGGNTLFLGANMAYWQTRYVDVNAISGGEDRGRQLVCYKRDHDPLIDRAGESDSLLRTTLFRRDARRPETMLMGVGWEGAAIGEVEPGTPFSVADASLPFFDGTGLKRGESVGKLVGYEWDRRDPEQDGQRLFRAGVSSIPELPFESLVVVFQGQPRGVTEDEQGRHIPLQNARAEAVYFKAPSGAKVFSAGTVRWSWGLNKQGYVHEGFQRLNENLHRYFLEKDGRAPTAADGSEPEDKD